MLFEDMSNAAISAGLEDIITVKEAAAFCRVSTKTIRRWICRDDLSATKSAASGGKLLICRDELIRKLTSN